MLQNGESDAALVCSLNVCLFSADEYSRLGIINTSGINKAFDADGTLEVGIKNDCFSYFLLNMSTIRAFLYRVFQGRSKGFQLVIRQHIPSLCTYVYPYSEP